MRKFLNLNLRKGNKFCNFVALAAFCLSSVLVSCSDSSNDVAGGVTDIGNSVAVGTVVDVAGVAVPNARVVAYYDSWNQDFIQDSVETWTNESGEFELSVDSSSSYVLFASAGENCGISATASKNPLSDSVGRIVTVGPRKAYSGLIVGRNSGTVRIVGSSAATPLDADGYFIFYDMPRGEITIAYSDSVHSQEKWRSRIQFSTSGEKSVYVLPELNVFDQDSSWLVSEKGDYYGATGYDGIRIYEPSDDRWNPPPAKEPDSAKRVYLPMDGSEIVFDNDSVRASEVNYVEGILDQAILLKPGQFIDLDTLDPCSGDFTLSLWTKWMGPNGKHQILVSQRSYWSDSTSRFQWHYETFAGQFAVMKSMPGFPYVVYFGDSSLVPQNEWAFLVLVFKTRKVSMYVNGEVVLSEINGESLSSQPFVPNELKRAVPLRIGGNEIEDETWNGVIDEVHLEPVARTADWIKSAYKNMSKGNPPPR